MNAETADATLKAGRREWLGLAVLALPTLLVAMDMTVLHLAVPALTDDLRPSTTQLLWSVDIYGFLVAGLLITMGSVGDRIGRRKLLLLGAAAFGVASVLASLADSAEGLIAARALLGVAGATLMPSTLSLIRTLFRDPAQRGAAIGVWAMCFALGSMVGPLIGGALLEFFWWGSVFLLAVPVMVLLLVVGPLVLPEHRDTQAGRVDLISAVLSLAATLSVIYGLKNAAEAGLGWRPAAFLAGGLLVGFLFLYRQRVLTDPMLDLRLFRNRTLSTALVMLTLVTVLMAGSQLFIMQYLQLVHGLSPLKAGLWSIPTNIGVMIGSIFGPMLLKTLPLGRLLATAMGVLTAGLLLLALVDGASDLALVVVASAVIGLGLGPMVALGTDLIVSAAPADRAGAASAVSETGTELGAALGIALLGSVGFAVYRSTVDGTLPAGLTPEQAATAEETLGGAVALAGELPAALGTQVLHAARAAFVDGIQATALTGAVIAALLVAVSLVLLRNATVPAPGHDPAETGSTGTETRTATPASGDEPAKTGSTSTETGTSVFETGR
ncbi:MFS transporter [Streptomyces sp. NPDC014870]|uniref:MFS transporter n=1 Tax=Streptomyces sp. NPDC014870 TaxID=3364925 RepID=UPI0036FD88E9